MYTNINIYIYIYIYIICICILYIHIYYIHNIYMNFYAYICIHTHMVCCAQSLSHVRLFATPLTVACQSPLSMEFSRPEFWSGLPCPPPGIFPTLGLDLDPTYCRRILYHLSHQGSPYMHINYTKRHVFYLRRCHTK